MNVLVIGGTGFLSSAIVRQLLEAGHEVTIFTRGQRAVPEGVKVITGDRREHAGFAERLAGSRYDAVVDCICYRLEDGEADVRAFADSGAHLLMISTDFVYGPERTLPMNEETPRRAMNVYGRGKVDCEEALFAACREGRLAATVLRPPHIMGPGSQLGSGSLQGRDPMLLDRLRQGAPVILLDDGALLLEPVVHDDVGRACVAALGKPQTFGEAYNVAGPDVVTTRRYYELIASALGAGLHTHSLPASVYVAAMPEKAPFAYHRTYDVSKLERDTGYRPATDVQYAIFSMIDWLQANEQARPYEPDPLDEKVRRLCRDFELEAGRLLEGGT
jgi:nucleoside-diphosphate-sugar epimerase